MQPTAGPGHDQWSTVVDPSSGDGITLPAAITSFSGLKADMILLLLPPQKQIYLINLRPTKNPDGFDDVSQRGQCRQPHGALKVRTQELGVVWDGAGRHIRQR